MGKKGSWLSAFKRAFTSSSKDNKPAANVTVSERKYVKEKKKWGLGRSKHGETNSFIPLYREPSSIEKILGDAEREQHQKPHQSSSSERVAGPEKVRKEKIHQPSSAQRVQNQTTQQGPYQNAQQLKMTAPKPNSTRSNASKQVATKNNASKQIIGKKYAQVSAIKIQAAYRGYIARKSYRTLKGLMRLQKAMRGQSVKRQTMNTMRCMQMLVRVQSQIRSRRLQMMESRSLQQHQTPNMSDKEIESWNLAHQSEERSHENWDDSVLAKQEIDARMQRKVEAVIKRERALAYAYAHKLLKVTPKSAHAVLADVKSGGFPWWWNWLERQVPHLPVEDHSTSRLKSGAIGTPKSTISNSHPYPTSHNKPSKANQNHFEITTPKSAKPLQSSNRWHGTMLRDDDSLTSCPVYTVPNYMAPTVSAKAKVRDAPASHEAKKRFSFALAQGIGSLKWSKGSMQMNKDTASQRTTGRHRSLHSLGSLSVDSTISLPVGVGRKQFK